MIRVCLLSFSIVNFKVHPCYRPYQCFIPYYSWILMFHCIVYRILSIHSPADRHLDCFHCACEAIVSNAALNICVKIFVWTFVFRFFGYTRRYAIAGSYHKSMFNFLRICFPSGSTILHSHQQYMSSMIIFWHPFQL